MAITLENAKNLRPGTTLYHITHRNSDKSPQRWKVNGSPQTWKTRPNEVRVPVKNGLRNCSYLTHNDLNLVCLTAEEALKEGAK